jgi:hypothetical protein
MRKGSKRLLQAGILAGIGYVSWRVWQAQVAAQHRSIPWETAPFPFPPVPRPAVSDPTSMELRVERIAPEDQTWVRPDTDGACPVSHPVKGKTASGIYHEPGGANYERTKADRCFVNAAAAEAQGLRAAKR